MDKKRCCAWCIHCDFEDYYDDETQDNISGYYCELNHDIEFDYDLGICDYFA